MADGIRSSTVPGAEARRKRGKPFLAGDQSRARERGLPPATPRDDSIDVSERPFTFFRVDDRTRILALVRRAERVTAGEVADKLGVSRQAAHRKLRTLAAEGELSLVGA